MTIVMTPAIITLKKNHPDHAMIIQAAADIIIINNFVTTDR
jgi:hypothetical protein